MLDAAVVAGALVAGGGGLGPFCCWGMNVACGTLKPVCGLSLEAEMEIL